MSASRSQARSKSASESTLSTAVAGADPTQDRRAKPDFSRPLGATRSVMILATLDASVASEQGVAGVNLRFPAAVVRCRTAWTTCVAYAFKSGVPCSHTQRVCVEWCKGCRGQGESVDTRRTDIPLEHRTHTPKKWPVVRSKSQVQMGQGLLVPVQGLGDWQLRECMWRHQAHAVSTAPQGRLHTVKERPAAGTRARVQQQPASGRATEWSTRDTLQVWPVIGAGSRRTPTASAANKPWQQTSNGRATAVIQGGRAWQQVVGHGGWLGGGGGPSHAYAHSPRRGLCSARQQD